MFISHGFEFTGLRFLDRCARLQGFSKNSEDFGEILLSWRRQHFRREKRNHRRLGSPAAPNEEDDAPCNHLPRSFQSYIWQMLKENEYMLKSKKANGNFGRRDNTFWTTHLVVDQHGCSHEPEYLLEPKKYRQSD